jgi:hypothetical protein
MPDSWHRGDWLVLDGAGPRCAAGWLRNGAWQELMVSDRDANVLDSIPAFVRHLCAVAGIPIDRFHGILYGCGPGSTLGLRLVAMMIQTWRLPAPQMRQPPALMVFNHLELTCTLLAPQHPDLLLLAPWRRDRLHACRCITSHSDHSNQIACQLHSIHPNDVADSAVLLLTGNRPPPPLPHIPVIEFPLRDLPTLLPDAAPVRVAQQPVPYAPATATYAKWNPIPHRPQ